MNIAYLWWHYAPTYKLAQYVVFPFVRKRYRVIGIQNIPKYTACVFAIGIHEHYDEPLIIGAHVHEIVTSYTTARFMFLQQWVQSKERWLQRRYSILKRHPRLARYCAMGLLPVGMIVTATLLGTHSLPITRKGDVGGVDANTNRESTQRALDILRSGGKVAVWITGGTKSSRIHPGALMLARDAGVVAIPVSINRRKKIVYFGKAITPPENINDIMKDGKKIARWAQEKAQ